MNVKPLIGLNADYRSARKDSPAFSYICAGYYDSLVKAGAIPLILPPLAEEKDLNRVLDLLDGVVLVGGADLDPRRDGFMVHPSVRMLDSRREDYDRMLMRLAARPPSARDGCGRRDAVVECLPGGQPFLASARRSAQSPAHSDRWTRPIATPWWSNRAR